MYTYIYIVNMTLKMQYHILTRKSTTTCIHTQTYNKIYKLYT